MTIIFTYFPKKKTLLAQFALFACFTAPNLSFTSRATICFWPEIIVTGQTDVTRSIFLSAYTVLGPTGSV